MLLTYTVSYAGSYKQGTPRASTDERAHGPACDVRCNTALSDASLRSQGLRPSLEDTIVLAVALEVLQQTPAAVCIRLGYQYIWTCSHSAPQICCYVPHRIRMDSAQQGLAKPSSNLTNEDIQHEGIKQGLSLTCLFDRSLTDHRPPTLVCRSSSGRCR